MTIPLATLEHGAIQNLHESVAGRRYAYVRGCDEGRMGDGGDATRMEGTAGRSEGRKEEYVQKMS